MLILNNVSKFYPYKDKLSLITILFNKKVGGLRALSNIDLRIERGETVGLIGRNGAGKSTLLKIMGKVSAPSEGKVTVNGKLSCIFEYSTSFLPELSGKENVFRRLEFDGIKANTLNDTYKSICNFAELDKNTLNMPVRTYSTGMNARLAFATALCNTNEILLIDELLSVGDEYFQGKCLNYLRNLCKNGRTVVMASHSLNHIRQFCNRVAWIEKGEIKKIGNSADVCLDYYSSIENNYNKFYGEILNFTSRSIKDKLYIDIIILRKVKTKNLYLYFYIADHQTGMLISIISSKIDNFSIPEGTGPIKISVVYDNPRSVQFEEISAVLLHGDGYILSSTIEDRFSVYDRRHNIVQSQNYADGFLFTGEGKWEIVQ